MIDFIPRRPAMDRFAEKCAFDPYTGCVMWIGGITMGGGHSQPYGSFKFMRRRWAAHRWSAVHIHGFDIEGLHVDHCCPCGPSTLCVEHVKPESAEVNRELQHSRPGRNWQSLETRQHWLFVDKGIRQSRPRPEPVPLDVPFFTPPLWLKPYLPKENSYDCPF